MKRLLMYIMPLGLALLLVSTNVTWAVDSFGCETIQDGLLVDVLNNPITTGYDDFGYNYQAHIFNGRYCDYDRVIGGDYCDVDLIMKWNDAWLSNRSCDGNFTLDRHYPLTSYKGSGAWLTNHQTGNVLVGTKNRKWTYFVKIVAVETTDTLVQGYYKRDGVEIGPAIWGDFAIIEQVSNDPSAGEHGILYKSPFGPGFGIYGNNP